MVLLVLLVVAVVVLAIQELGQQAVLVAEILTIH
jgi:hypothetical protein